MVNVLVAGDTSPVGKNQILFQKGDAKGLLHDLADEVEAADLFLLNLETPLVSWPTPINKVGPVLGAPKDCVEGLKAMGVRVAGLANNHIMDHGPQGLKTTIESLQARDISVVGAGKDLSEARRILVMTVGGLRLGILAVAESEFSIARYGSPGANPLEVIDYVRNVESRRKEFDVLIVLLHGGNEHYPYPRPSLRETCHFLVEQGAGAVICQHTHCAGCWEIYRGAPIVYGQGNFLFDRAGKPPAWYKGMLVSLHVEEGLEIEARMVPYRQSAAEAGLWRLPQKQEELFFRGLDERSVVVRDPELLEAKWKAFCRANRRYYLNTIDGGSRIVRRLAEGLGLLHRIDSPEVQCNRLNLIRCESHREVLIRILEEDSAQFRA